MLVVFFFLTAALISNISGQGHPHTTKLYFPAGSTEGGYYTFVPLNHTNCLWKVGGSDWQKIYFDQQNKFLQKPGRKYERNGIVYVLVHPGERIFVPSGVKTRVDLEPISMVTQFPQPASQSSQKKDMLAQKSDDSYNIIPLLILFTIISAVVVFILFLSTQIQKKISERKTATETSIIEEKKSSAPPKPTTPGYISLAGLNKAAVLAALYNASKPQGMGFMHYDPMPMTTEQAQQLLDSGQTYFDYLIGRVMKVDLSRDEFSPWGYDRDNGDGAAMKAITSLSTGSVNSSEIQEKHFNGVIDSALKAMDMMQEDSTLEGNTMTLGLKDVSDVLGPKVKKTIEK